MFVLWSNAKSTNPFVYEVYHPLINMMVMIARGFFFLSRLSINVVESPSLCRLCLLSAFHGTNGRSENSAVYVEVLK